MLTRALLTVVFPDDNRGCAGLAQAGSELGAAELDLEAADLAATQEGVDLLQLQELHLQLLPGLSRVEQQVTLHGDVILHQEGQGQPGLGFEPSARILHRRLAQGSWD